MQMAKKDKEFGKWKSTTLFPRKLSIKQYENGFIIKHIKEKKEERIPHKNTDYTDTSALIKKKIDKINRTKSKAKKSRRKKKRKRPVKDKIIKHLKKKETCFKAKLLAKRLKIPYNNLRKHLTQLRKNKEIIRFKRGYWGYRFEGDKVEKKEKDNNFSEN